MGAVSSGRSGSLELRALLFVGLAVVGAVAGALFLASRQGFFTPRSELLLLAHSARGLRVGQPVELSGFPIGQVRSVELEGIDRVAVVVAVDRDSLRWIRADSRARLVKPDLLADAVVEITPGSDDAPEIAEGGTLRLDSGRELSGMADTVLGETAATLSELRDLLATLSADGELARTVRNASELTERFLAKEEATTRQVEEVLFRMGTTVAHWDDVISHADATFSGFDRTLDHTRETLAGIDDLTAPARERLPELLDGAQRSLDHLERTAATLHRTTELRGPELERLLVEGDSLVRELRILTLALQRTWPIRNHLPEEPTAPRPPTEEETGASDRGDSP